MKNCEHNDGFPADTKVNAIRKTLHYGLANPIKHLRKRPWVAGNHLQRLINFSEECIA